MKIVVDTNVLLSGIVFGGRPCDLLTIILKGGLDVYASPEIVNEYMRIYSELKLKYQKRDHIEIKNIIDVMNVSPTYSHIEVCRDPDDNKFIECAFDNKCTRCI